MDLNPIELYREDSSTFKRRLGIAAGGVVGICILGFVGLWLGWPRFPHFRDAILLAAIVQGALFGLVLTYLLGAYVRLGDLVITSEHIILPFKLTRRRPFLAGTRGHRVSWKDIARVVCEGRRVVLDTTSGDSLVIPGSYNTPAVVEVISENGLVGVLEGMESIERS